MFITHLECMSCGTAHEHKAVQNTCRKCGGPLAAKYDLEKAKESLSKASLRKRSATLWRYREVLPVIDDRNVVSLGEGYTPVTPLRGRRKVVMKDDGMIPTGTFKARGLCVAVSKAKEFGIKKLAIPSAGNAASALACYAARAGISALAYLPKDAPHSSTEECRIYGTRLVLVDGHIGDAAKRMRSEATSEGYFDVSTLREPYRLEGKKTMGYEILEQLGEVPDVIVYPTGGGTGLLGMWKAFEEMERLGWVGRERPRMISVQSSGCAPIVQAFTEGRSRVEDPFPSPSTIAPGLRVPQPFASEHILRVIKESGGLAMAVNDDDILSSMRELAHEGMLVGPEGAATHAAYSRLIEGGTISRDEGVLLYITGTGLKNLDLFAMRPHPASAIRVP